MGSRRALSPLLVPDEPLPYSVFALCCRTNSKNSLNVYVKHSLNFTPFPRCPRGYIPLRLKTWMVRTASSPRLLNTGTFILQLLSPLLNVWFSVWESPGVMVPPDKGCNERGRAGGLGGSGGGARGPGRRRAPGAAQADLLSSPVQTAGARSRSAGGPPAAGECSPFRSLGFC